MENKELIAYRNTKPHQNKEMLSALFSEGLNTSEIGKKLHVSTKLVEIMRKQFGLRGQFFLQEQFSQLQSVIVLLQPILDQDRWVLDTPKIKKNIFFGIGQN